MKIFYLGVWFCKIFLIVTFSGCYYLETSLHHLKLLTQAEKIQSLLENQDSRLSEKDFEKLRLTPKVLDFMQTDLDLKTHGNYEKFVFVDKQYVTYLLSASDKWKLKLKFWSYPIIGQLPYRGYAALKQAEQEEQELQNLNYDTDLRGVSAYSTLGWFKDPVLSTMMHYSQSGYVETLIHEIIHANIFFKNDGEFNEQIATFLGFWGAQLYFLKEKNLNAFHIKELEKTLQYKILFAKFLKKEKKELEKWYEQLSSEEKQDKVREKRLNEIVKRCEDLLSQNEYKTQSCKNLSNNAKIMAFGVYYDDIDLIYEFVKNKKISFSEFLHLLKNLKGEKNPRKIFYEKITQ
jgi:predicted aminopeptidase